MATYTTKTKEFGSITFDDENNGCVYISGNGFSEPLMIARDGHFFSTSTDMEDRVITRVDRNGNYEWSVKDAAQKWIKERRAAMARQKALYPERFN